MNKQQAKFLSYYILQLLKAINIIAVTVILIFNITILNYNYIQKKMNQTNYYETLYNDILDQMEDIIIPTGFDKDIFKDTFTIKDVTKIEQKVIHNFYYNEKILVDTSSFKEKLEENINKELKEKHLKVENEKDITNLVNELADVYENNLYYFNFLENYKGSFYKLRYVSNIILVVSILLLILFTILLDIIHKKRDKMSIPLITSGITFIVLYFYFKTKLNIDNLVLYSAGLSDMIITIFNSVFKILIIISIIYILIGLLNRFVYFQKVLKHKKKKHKKDYTYEEDLD